MQRGAKRMLLMQTTLLIASIATLLLPASAALVDWSDGIILEAGTSDWRESDFHVAMSGDGGTVAIGAPLFNETVGKVRVFARYNTTTTNGQWNMLGNEIVGSAEYSYAGLSLSLNQNGTRLAVGFPASLQIAPLTLPKVASFARVYQLQKTNSNNGQEEQHSWVQMGTDIVFPGADDLRFPIAVQSGWSVQLDDIGSTLAVSAPGYFVVHEGFAGQVQVLRFNDDNNDWEPLGQTLQGDGTTGHGYGAGFGSSLALSPDASTLAIGHRYDGENQGSVRVFRLQQQQQQQQTTDNNYYYEWQPIGSIIRGDVPFAEAGSAVDLSLDGTILSVGFGNHHIKGSSLRHTGLVRVYEFVQDDWVQRGSDIRPDRDIINGFGSMGEGRSLSLSRSGETLAVGAPAFSVNDNVVGLARVFQYNGTEWSQLGSALHGERRYSQGREGGGWLVAISDDDESPRLVVGAPVHKLCFALDFSCTYDKQEDENWTGHVRVYDLVDATAPPSTAPVTFPPPPVSSPTVSPSLNTASPTLASTTVTVTPLPTNEPTLPDDSAATTISLLVVAGLVVVTVLLTE